MIIPIFNTIGYPSSRGLVVPLGIMISPGYGFVIEVYYHPHTGEYREMMMQPPPEVQIILPEDIKNEEL